MRSERRLVRSEKWIRGQQASCLVNESSRRACWTYPEGIKGLSLGFQPQVLMQESIHPGGVVGTGLVPKMSNQILGQTIYRPFRGGSGCVACSWG